ncbi:uncharacterized protein LOC123035270 [Varanus komodoensis]|uniref:uncharacterized protein LOC123035270 n=1 Tax=Varanus komodoensis TaxID=61221 RepID=UPI001CF7E551|nr:uncharacterized protein LOC123035270 [Varanus komodoensis]
MVEKWRTLLQDVPQNQTPGALAPAGSLVQWRPPFAVAAELPTTCPEALPGQLPPAECRTARSPVALGVGPVGDGRVAGLAPPHCVRDQGAVSFEDGLCLWVALGAGAARAAWRARCPGDRETAGAASCCRPQPPSSQDWACLPRLPRSPTEEWRSASAWLRSRLCPERGAAVGHASPVFQTPDGGEACRLISDASNSASQERDGQAKEQAPSVAPSASPQEEAGLFGSQRTLRHAQCSLEAAVPT